MRFQNILFDLDGTVTDPARGIIRSVLHALHRMDIPGPDFAELTDFIGPPLHESFRQRFDLTEEQSFQAVEWYREYYTKTGIYENEVYPGMQELLEALSQHSRLLLATSKPQVYARQILRHFRLDAYFSVVMGANLDGTLTGKGEVIEAALEKAGITPSGASVMVGDRSYDINGARECGIPVVAVTWGYGSLKELAERNPDYLAHSMPELAQLLGA